MYLVSCHRNPVTPCHRNPVTHVTVTTEPDVSMPKLVRSSQPPTATQQLVVHGIDTRVPVFERTDLAAGQRIAGPAIISESVATTWLVPGWNCEVDGYGNLLLNCDCNGT